MGVSPPPPPPPQINSPDVFKEDSSRGGCLLDLSLPHLGKEQILI